MHETIERYRKHTKDVQSNTPVLQNIQHLKHETAILAKKIELLEISKRKLLGEGLGSCSISELQQIEQQLEKSVCTVRARKMQVFKEQIEQLKEKEKNLAADNALLLAKYEVQPRQESPEDGGNVTSTTETSENSDVETELFIGPPEKRFKRIMEK
ncbi:hypothetical protein AgCh_019191 [Apium graveolens]